MAHDHEKDRVKQAPHLEKREAPLYVQDLLKEMLTTREVSARRWMTEAERNERWIIGDQWTDINDSFRLVSLEWGSNTPKYQVNALRNLHSTLTARFMDDLPSVKAWPNEIGSDVGIAEVGNQVLRYLYESQQLDHQSYEAVSTASMHSAVGFLTTWDPTAGPISQGVQARDDLGYEAWEADPENPEGQTPVWEVQPGTPEGDVRIELVTVLEFWTDGAEDEDKQEWQVVIRHVPHAQAVELMRLAKYDESEWSTVEPQEQETIWGTKVETVPVYEIWHKPSARIPEGLFSQVVNGDWCVSKKPYVYEHGQLPVSIFKFGPRRQSPYGSTPLSDAIWAQRRFNEIMSLQAQRIRELAYTKLLAPQAIAKQLESKNQVVAVKDASLLEAIRWFGPPEPSNLMLDELARAREDIHDLAGVSEMAAGQDDKDRSGRSVAYLNKLDEFKYAHARISWTRTLRRVFLQAFALYQQYVKAPRVLQIAGEQHAEAVEGFLGAQLNGLDIRLEPASGLERFGAAAGEEAMMQAEVGLISPDAAAETIATGLPPADEGIQRHVIRAQISQVLAGENVEPDPRVGPPVAVEELTRAIAENIQDPAIDGLWEMLQFYKQQMAAAQQPQPPAGGPPQEMGGPPAPELGPGGIPVE